MSTYAFRDLAGDLLLSAPEFARPLPAHAQRAAAIRAAEAAEVARYDPEAVVTDVGRPAAYGKDPVTKAARDLIALAEAHGFECELRTREDRCGVQGIRRRDRVAFRAYWVRGRTIGGSWHEPWRWTLAPDPRPIKVDATARTGLKNHRSEGMGETRLVNLGSPYGVGVLIGELTKRIEQS